MQSLQCVVRKEKRERTGGARQQSTTLHPHRAVGAQRKQTRAREQRGKLFIGIELLFYFLPSFSCKGVKKTYVCMYLLGKYPILYPRESGAEYGTRPNMARSAARKLGARHAEKNSISSARKLSARHAGQKYFCRRRSSVENPRRGPLNFPTFFQVWK